MSHARGFLGGALVGALLVPALLATPVRGQAVTGFPTDGPGGARGALVMEVSLEPELVVSIGYLHRLTSAGSASDLRVGTGLELPPYLVGRGSGRANVIIDGRWRGEGGWGVGATSMAYVARNRNRAGTMQGLGVEVRAAPGYGNEQWSLGLDLGVQATLLAHVRHSDVARRTFEDRHPGAEGTDGPIDGWYGDTSQRIRLGLAGARRISDGLAVRLAGGSLFALQRQGLLLSFAHAQVPAYLETSLRAEW